MRHLTGHYTDDKGEQHNFDLHIAGSWEELTAKQYAVIMELLSYQNADKHVIAASLLSVLFGDKNFDILKYQDDEDRLDYLPLTNFIFEETPPVKNFFPKIRMRKKDYIAPADDLSNLSFGEWCFAYQFFTYYKQYNDDSMLHKLIATLYRPADPTANINSPHYTGDNRERFNENLIEQRAIGLRDIQSEFKQAIFGWLTAAFMHVTDSRKNLFPEQSQQDQAAEPQGDARTWLSVFRELLGPKWGTIEQLKFTNALFVLDYLDEQQIEFNKATTPAS